MNDYEFSIPRRVPDLRERFRVFLAEKVLLRSVDKIGVFYVRVNIP
jgi:hypothetical protein